MLRKLLGDVGHKYIWNGKDTVDFGGRGLTERIVVVHLTEPCKMFNV